MDRFHDVLEESTCHWGEALVITYSFQEKMYREILTMPYLKIILIVYLRKIFQLIFHLSCHPVL